jgi:hypothetical protein
VSITATSIYQNTASSVSRACFEPKGPPQRPVDVTDVLFCFTGWRHSHRWCHCEHQRLHHPQQSSFICEHTRRFRTKGPPQRPVDVTDMCVSFCIWQAVSARAGFEQRAHHNAPLEVVSQNIPQLFTGRRCLHQSSSCEHHQLHHQQQSSSSREHSCRFRTKGPP